MDYSHRKLIEKYSQFLQGKIDIHDTKFKYTLSQSKIFTACMLEDIYDGEASFFEELPTRGPYAFFRFIDLLKTNGYFAIAEKLCHEQNPEYDLSDQHGCYIILVNDDCNGTLISEKLDDFQRGLVIEGVAFDRILRQTFGCPRKYSKYKPFVSPDDLKNRLKKFSNKISKVKINEVHYCFVIILSLGAKIYGEDSKYILPHDIVNFFSDSKCPSLKYKPKIFLMPSFDNAHNDFVENIKISDVNDNVNDTFIWYFPSFKCYKYVKGNNKFFGEILSENLENNIQKLDFETMFKLSFAQFQKQLQLETT